MRLFILPPRPLVIFLFSTVTRNGAHTETSIISIDI